jgi:hypothetical protein
MNSRIAISALFILIAGMVIASQGTGLLEKLKVLQASCTNKISEVRTLPISDNPRKTGNPLRAGTISPDAQSIVFNFPNTTHALGWHARHLQRFVLTLINSYRQGE